MKVAVLFLQLIFLGLIDSFQTLLVDHAGELEVSAELFQEHGPVVEEFMPVGADVVVQHVLVDSLRIIDHLCIFEPDHGIQNLI